MLFHGLLHPAQLSWNFRSLYFPQAGTSPHLHSVHWNEVKIVPYGTPKQEVVDVVGGILFDDELPNRTNWIGTAYDVENILEILKGLI